VALEALKFNLLLNPAFIFFVSLFTFENKGVIWDYCNCF
jgi:hypothetical protein